jgi:choline-sulfatase
MEPMPRPAQFILALLSLSFAFCRGGPARQRFPGAPVILISIDTLRADRLPAYGYKLGATPALDRFRRDAILYRNAYSPCPMTLPTHVSMLTGLLPPEHGVRSNAGFTFDGQAHAHLPGMLKARGYATGAAVSTYVLRGETGLGALFDSYEDSIDALHGSAFAEQQRPGAVTSKLARRWLDAQPKGPLFLFFHIYEPHVPYDPPEPYRSRFAHPYDGEVAYSDAIVGELLDHLRATGIYDRALVIVTSDHGEGLGDHGEQQHSILLYAEAIRVPLLLKLPQSQLAGRTVDAPAQLTDLVPTVAEVLGIDPPKKTAGVSLLRLLGRDVPERTIYSETLYPRIHLGWSELRSVADIRWHYIHGPKPELYDLQADARETKDVIADNPRDATRLRDDLARYPAVDAAPGSVDLTVAERLAALGYVGTPHAPTASAELRNPRDSLGEIERLGQGFRLAAARRHEEATATLEAVVKDDPALVEAWIRLGEVLSEAGRPKEAAKAFERALARSSVAFGDVLVSLGYARLQAGELEAAAAAARRALPTLPAKAHELLARVALAQNRLRDAQEEARAAGSGRNPQPSSRLIAAEVLIRRGSAAEAATLLDEIAAQAAALEMAAIPRLELLRADALARTGRLAEAEAAYRREITAFPANLGAYANLAALLYAQRKVEEVEPMLEALVAANPNPRAYRLAVTTLEAFGERSRAARWRARATRSTASQTD